MLVQIKTNINSVTFGEAKSSLKENRNLTVGNLTSLFKLPQFGDPSGFSIALSLSVCFSTF